MKQKGRFPRLFLGLLMTIVLFLFGCSQQSDLTLYNDQSWEYVSSFTFDPDDIPDVSLDIPIIEEALSVGVASSLLPESVSDMTLDMAANMYRQEGYRVETEQKRALGGDTSYVMTITGQGWDKLARMLSGPMLEELGLPASQVTVTEVSDGAVHFVVALPVDTYGLGSMLPTEFRLHGGSILDTNAYEVRGGTATWFGVNSYMEATVEPKSLINWPLVIGIALGGAVLLASGLLLFTVLGNRSRRSSRGSARGRLTRRRGDPRRPLP